jgi:DNA-binding NtrC family response regulator
MRLWRRTNNTQMDLFKVYNRPGNICELQNVVERAVILCEGETLSVDESWFKYDPPQPEIATEMFTEIRLKTPPLLRGVSSACAMPSIRPIRCRCFVGHCFF